MVIKLKVKIEKNIPIVIDNENKILELHELRKDTKKLRYLIELVTKSDYEKSNKRSIEKKDSDKQLGENHNRILQQLEKIQGMLGEIHDYDVTIDYLKQQHVSNNSLIADTIENIMKVRRKRYSEFIEYNKPTNLEIK